MQPAHLHQHAHAASARKSADMVSANMVSILPNCIYSAYEYASMYTPGAGWEEGLGGGVGESSDTEHAYRHRLNGYLDQQVPSMCLASCSRIVLIHAVLNEVYVSLED